MAVDQTELYQMLEKIANGDGEVFGHFYDASISRTFGVIIKITLSRPLAEEVASDVYMQVWRTAASYDATLSAPMTWLSMIARSRAIDALRREKSSKKNQLPLIEDFDLPDDATLGPFMETLNAEKTARMNELLESLDDVDRQIIVLAFYKGMSHSEIATFTGKPLGTVKTILRRAQATLKSAWRSADFLAPLVPQIQVQ